MNDSENTVSKVEKIQTAFQLPAEMAEWVREEEKRTGLNLSRLAVAAFTAYFLRDGLTKHEAIHWGMKIDSGEIALKDLRAAYWEAQLAIYKGLAIRGKEQGDAKFKAAVTDDIRRIEYLLLKAKQGEYVDPARAGLTIPLDRAPGAPSLDKGFSMYCPG